jgi:hypothetical protein
VPPRPPPSPPALTVLCSLAAVAAAWLSLALDQIVRGAAGALVGVPFFGVWIDPAHNYTLQAVQGQAAGVGGWGWSFVVLSGTPVLLVLALAFHALVGALRSPGWLRGLSLGWVVVALLWIPASLAAAALPGGGGPVAELYLRLGDPQAGRWTAAALGLLGLFLAAGAASERAVAVGRAWMRADAVEFRRRLVRVSAGWPGAAALMALGVGAGWAGSAWLLVVPVAAVAAMHFRTR